jgi:hypothetical protein
MRMKPRIFKSTDEEYDRWKELAWRERLTWSEWVRRRLNAQEALVTVAKSVKEDKGCVHRLPKGSWCKRCEAIKK